MSELRAIVREVIDELDRQGRLKPRGPSREAGERVRAFYDGAEDPACARALSEIRGDKYWPVVPYYYRDGMTLRWIASELRVDISTVMRHKRRLMLTLAREMEGDGDD